MEKFANKLPNVPRSQCCQPSVEQLTESQVVAWNSRIFIMTHVTEADLHPSSRCFGCILENAGKKKIRLEMFCCF